MTHKEQSELIDRLTECLDEMLIAATTGILPGTLADRALELIDQARGE